MWYYSILSLSFSYGKACRSMKTTNTRLRLSHQQHKRVLNISSDKVHVNAFNPYYSTLKETL